MADEVPLPPIEIPWRLASTTQPLDRRRAGETAISLFTYVPDDAGLTASFPDERLVYLKVTTTVARRTFRPTCRRSPASALGEGIPCYHLRLDLKVRPAGGAQGTIRPYFHAAAPMHRRWIQIRRRRRRDVRGRVRRAVHGQEREPDVREREHERAHDFGRRERRRRLRPVLGVGLGAPHVDRRGQRARRRPDRGHDDASGRRGAPGAREPPHARGERAHAARREVPRHAVPALLARAPAAGAAVARPLGSEPVVQPAARAAFLGDRGRPGVHGCCPRAARRATSAWRRAWSASACSTHLRDP